MRLDTGAMRSAKRSPSDSSTTVVAVAAGRPDVSRENSLVGMVIPSPLLVSGTAKPTSAKHGSGGPPRRADLIGRVVGRKRPHADPTPGGSGRARRPRFAVEMLTSFVRCAAPLPLAPELVTAPRTVATSAASAVKARDCHVWAGSHRVMQVLRLYPHGVYGGATRPPLRSRRTRPDPRPQRSPLRRCPSSKRHAQPRPANEPLDAPLRSPLRRDGHRHVP